MYHTVRNIKYPYIPDVCYNMVYDEDEKDHIAKIIHVWNLIF